jgi:nucleoside-diphosphate-sugar epimerase
MRILILGGTRFSGRFLAEAAVEAGHELALFNRGQSSPGALSDIEQIRPQERPAETGMAPERERELLERWRDRPRS